MKDKIIINNLDFSYGNKKVLDNINLEISNGVYGLVGRNGAGKSTLMKLIVGLLPIKSGNIRVLGTNNINEIRKNIGYLTQDFDFYPDMSVIETLEYLASLSEISKKEAKIRIKNLLDLVNLEDNQKTKVKNLSGGMKRRLGISQALLNDPRVLIVDEPTAGLDPEERIRFRNTLSELSKDKIIIFSTHIASDVESIANNIGILNNGKFIYNGNIKDLIDANKSYTYETVIGIDELSEFKKSHIIYEQKENYDGIKVRFLYNGRPKESFRRIEPNLESSYMMKIYEEDI
jgi:ABC transporter (ATP-binding protein)